MSQPCWLCQRPALDRDYALCARCKPKVRLTTRNWMQTATTLTDFEAAKAQALLEVAA